MKRVVITGLGVVTGLASDWESFWQALIQGRSAIRSWSLPDAGKFPVKYAAPVDLDALAALPDNAVLLSAPMERRTAFGAVAAQRALRDARLVPDDVITGVAVGSGVPERDPRDMLLLLGEQGPDWTHFSDQRRALNRNTGLTSPNDSLGVLVARRHGLRGPVLNFSTACAGAAHAIGAGFRMIRRGEVECMVVGAADSVLNLPTMTGLCLLGAPSLSERFGDRLCRPFDRDRSGLVAGEGAGMLVLESEAHATRRGAKIYAEICGFGSSLDAYRITAPEPEGAGAALAMRRALRDAGLEPEQIGCINAHGTSTPLNDVAETKAIKSVFARGEHYRNLLVTANKSMLGHLIAAAGAPELIATALSILYGVVPPTINLEQPGPGCDLDYVPGVARKASIGAALSNSFGFGGLNACLAVRSHD